MSDSITSISGSTPSQRAQSAAQASSLRNNATVLNAIVETQQKNAGRTGSVALAVPQTSGGTNSSKTKLPRGSLVDVLA